MKKDGNFPGNKRKTGVPRHDSDLSPRATCSRRKKTGLMMQNMTGQGKKVLVSLAATKYL